MIAGEERERGEESDWREENKDPAQVGALSGFLFLESLGKEFVRVSEPILCANQLASLQDYL